MKSRSGLLVFIAAIAAVLWFTLRSTAGGPVGGEDGSSAITADRAAGLGGLGEANGRAGKAKLPMWEQPKASVSGRVLDEAGQGILGAQVCAITESSELSQAQLREVPCVTSAHDGYFRLEDLHPVRYRISASAPTFIPGQWHDEDQYALPLSAGQDVVGIEVVLEGGGVEIRGVVRDIAGGVIEGALVRSGGGVFWFSGSSSAGAAMARSDADGKFSMWVKPGQLTLRAQAEGYADGDQRGATPGHLFEIHLSPESVLVGRVVMADSGQPVEGARVSTGSWRGAGTFTDADGRFRLDGLEPGSYKPVARSASAYGEPEKRAHLGLGQQSDPIVIRMHPAGSLLGSVSVQGDDAEPCKAGYVSLQDETHDRTKREQLRPDGSVELHGLLPGTYSVDVGCDGYRARDSYDDIVVEAGVQATAAWVVEDGREIRGRVVDADGQPLAKVRVRATPQNVESRAQRTAGADKTNEDGEFEIRGLLPGEYELKASHQSREAKATIAVTEASDADGVILEFAAGATVRGVVVDADGTPVGGVSVRDKGPVKRWTSKMTDDEGNFEYIGLPAGEHRFYANEDMFGSTMRAPGTTDDDVQGVTVELEDGDEKEVTITVERQSGELSGRVVDDTGGPVADAFIRAERESDSATTGAGQNRRSARWGGWSETPVLTDQEGRFTLTGLPADAQFTVYAHRKGGGEGIAEHVADGASGIEITIEATGSLSGKIVTSSGEIPDEFTVTARNKIDGIRRREGFFRTEGVFTFEELPPGKYEVTASSPSGDASTEVEVETGSPVRGVELELTRRVTARGIVVDGGTQEPVSGLMVIVSPKGGGFSFSGSDHGEDAKHITGEDGRFEVERAPTGSIRLLVLDRNFGGGKYDPAWITRTVPDEDPADFGAIEVFARRLDKDEQAGDLGYELKQADAGQERDEVDLKIALVRPGGPAAAAGLKPGDTIESVDGHGVDGDGRSHYRSLTRVPPGTKVSFGLADGRTIAITAGKPL